MRLGLLILSSIGMAAGLFWGIFTIGIEILKRPEEVTLQWRLLVWPAVLFVFCVALYRFAETRKTNP
jgi:hypothetical protein